jgi:hypothetical protein
MASIDQPVHQARPGKSAKIAKAAKAVNHQLQNDSRYESGNTLTFFTPQTPLKGGNPCLCFSSSIYPVKFSHERQFREMLILIISRLKNLVDFSILSIYDILF